MKIRTVWLNKSKIETADYTTPGATGVLPFGRLNSVTRTTATCHDSRLGAVRVVRLTSEPSGWPTVLRRRGSGSFADIRRRSTPCCESNWPKKQTVSTGRFFGRPPSLTSADVTNWGRFAFSAFLGRPLTTCNIRAMLLHHDGRTTTRRLRTRTRETGGGNEKNVARNHR